MARDENFRWVNVKWGDFSEIPQSDFILTEHFQSNILCLSSKCKCEKQTFFSYKHFKIEVIKIENVLRSFSGEWGTIIRICKTKCDFCSSCYTNGVSIENWKSLGSSSYCIYLEWISGSKILTLVEEYECSGLSSKSM